MNFDFRRRLRESDGGIAVKIALQRTTLIDGDLVVHQLTQAFDHRALALVFGVERVDDLAAYITRNPHFLNLNLLGGVDANFRDFSKIAAMRKVKGDAHRSALR